MGGRKGHVEASRKGVAMPTNRMIFLEGYALENNFAQYLLLQHILEEILVPEVQRSSQLRLCAAKINHIYNQCHNFLIQ
ncbi:hypothetical protein GBA52_012142 [Prunus armeniaca]|nr:hypothetical protein GBA52_012142 [Prunus armeniaca]